MPQNSLEQRYRSHVPLPRLVIVLQIPEECRARAPGPGAAGAPAATEGLPGRALDGGAASPPSSRGAWLLSRAVALSFKLKRSKGFCFHNSFSC